MIDKPNDGRITTVMSVCRNEKTVTIRDVGHHPESLGIIAVSREDPCRFKSYHAHP